MVLKHLDVSDDIVDHKLSDPRRVRNKNLADLSPRQIGRLNGVNRGLNHHVVEPKPTDHDPTRTRIRVLV
ncbi:hypothetical protein ACFX16_014884 [Malus domestica]